MLSTSELLLIDVARRQLAFQAFVSGEHLAYKTASGPPVVRAQHLTPGQVISSRGPLPRSKTEVCPWAAV